MSANGRYLPVDFTPCCLAARFDADAGPHCGMTDAKRGKPTDGSAAQQQHRRGHSQEQPALASADVRHRPERRTWGRQAREPA